MRSLTFFIVPLSFLFLLISLGLVAKGVADLSVGLQYFNEITSGSNPFYTTGYRSSGGSTRFSIVSSSTKYGPYTPPGFSSYTYSRFDYSSALNSLYSRSSALGSVYSRYSYTLNARDQEQPTGIIRRASKASQTVAPVVRQAPQSTPAPVLKRETKGLHTLQKRANTLDQAKSRIAAILAFFVLQLVAIVGLLVTGIVFLVIFRKLDNIVQEKMTTLQKNNNVHPNSHDLNKSSEMQNTSLLINQRTSSFQKFFIAFLILTVFYFIFGIVSFALLGSLGGISISPLASATVAFWVLALVTCIAICVMLFLDRRTSEHDGTHLQNPSVDKSENGEEDRMVMNRSQEHQNTQSVSMPQPQTSQPQPQLTPAQQQPTAEHQQQYPSEIQHDPNYPTYTPQDVSGQGSSASQYQRPLPAAPIEGQL